MQKPPESENSDLTQRLDQMERNINDVVSNVEILKNQSEITPNRMEIVEGSWESWSQWSSCSISCGNGGSQNRFRKCGNNSLCNGKSYMEEFRECNTVPCKSNM